MSNLILPVILAITTLLLPAFNETAYGVSVTGLRFEGIENPKGIDAENPRLSWMLESREPQQVQKAYQVLVASSRLALDEGKADLWNSGKVVSDESVWVRYEGKQLTSHQECFWKVRVWDRNGGVSKWSKPARWSLGMLSQEDWHGQWIGQDDEAKTSYLDGTFWIWGSGTDGALQGAATNWFRRLVTLPPGKKIKQALFEYTGDKECRGFLSIFDLGARNNPRTVKYNDVTGRLVPGKTHVFGLVGRTDGMAPARIIGRLSIEFEGGDRIVIPTDEKWKVSKHFEENWNTLEFDDSKWDSAKVLAPVETGSWSKPTTAEDRRFPARWLRKEFGISKEVTRATVSYCGLGLSEMYINGKKVGDHVLSPALSQYDKRVFYVTHDVTELIRAGSNAMGVVLGGGRFCSDRSKVYTGTVNFGWPKLLAQLRIEHADGAKTEVVSEATWKLSTEGPIRSSGEFDGEEYDARKEFPRWSAPGFDDRGWRSANVVSAPKGKLSAQRQHPIRVTGTIKPVRMTEIGPGVYVFDMGQNMVGWCRLKVRGPAGRQIQLRHAETLNEDGTLCVANLRGARATDYYTLKGTGEETYEPRFTYHGFRFVEMTGFPGRPTLATLEGRIVNDDLPKTGEFSCSNELLNRIYTNAVWGIRGNYRSIPTDCPQRDERQGWLGDRSEVCGGEAFIFDVSLLYAKWLQDISDSQKQSGSLPDVAPAYWPIYSDNVTWPSTLIIASGVMHRQYADMEVIADRFESAGLWMTHMSQFLTNGVISRDSYGDWCVPPEDLRLIHSKDPARQTDKTLLATAYFYHDLQLMERYSRLLRRSDDAERYGALAQQVKTAFNDRFLDRQNGWYNNGSQTACVLPLAFGLAPDKHRGTVFRRLVDKIEKETKGHIGTGLIGGQYLMRVLSDNGRPDLAYKIATQGSYPGWGYMVNRGATTIWELWNGATADPTMNSGNHVMLLGDLVVWLYEYLAGIAPDPDKPGFKHIIMRPYPVGNLSHVKASYRSSFGLIKSEWHTDAGKFDWRITIPPNTTATVHFPAGFSGTAPLKVKGAQYIGLQEGRAVYQAGSGEYRFSSR